MGPAIRFKNESFLDASKFSFERVLLGFTAIVFAAPFATAEPVFYRCTAADGFTETLKIDIASNEWFYFNERSGEWFSQNYCTQRPNPAACRQSDDCFARCEFDGYFFSLTVKETEYDAENAVSLRRLDTTTINSDSGVMANRYVHEFPFDGYIDRGEFTASCATISDPSGIN